MKLHIRAWLEDENEAFPVHEVVVTSEGTDARKAMMNQAYAASNTIVDALRDDLMEKIWVTEGVTK